ncbi:hypothetical protein Tco_0564787 [Tanacetum coccineum]
MTKKNSGEHAMISYIQKQRRTNHKDFPNYVFACFLSQHEPIKISQAFDDESWVEAMQEELLQFKIQKVWTLVDLSRGKKAIGTKWVYRNKKDERVEAIRLFLAFASFMNFPVYQMDVKSAFFYDTIEEEQKDDGIFISQDKYVGEILKKFSFSSLRTASTPMETNKALTKDEDGEDVDVHLYRSMIGSLMYLTSSRPDIMFLVCACLRFQVQPKVSHLNALFQTVTMQVPSWTGNPQQEVVNFSWQCKKQTVTKIHVDNESAICVVKNPIYHSKTKHIKIMNHFIRDSYEKRLIEMVKIHTDNNVADLLTKAFDGMDIGGRPRCQDTIGGAPAQTRSERVFEKPNEPPLSEGHTSGSGEGSMEYHFELTDNVPPIPYDSPLSGGNTPRSDEGRMELIKELMETCTSLAKRVLALEEAKIA